jgi:hypothetical protein
VKVSDVFGMRMLRLHRNVVYVGLSLAGRVKWSDDSGVPQASEFFSDSDNSASLAASKETPSKSIAILVSTIKLP